MVPELFITTALSPALKLLPPAMDSIAARAMVLTICLQESGLRHRAQFPIDHAHGYAQFEKTGGIRGVLNHATTKPLIHSVLTRLDYDFYEETSFNAIEHNDILAIAYARLLLYTVPERLPTMKDPNEGWRQYLSAWRPGKPHRKTWDAYYSQGWFAAMAIK